MSHFRLTFRRRGKHCFRLFSLSIGQSDLSSARGSTWIAAALFLLVAQGAIQHWHSPVHWVELLQASTSDDGQDVIDEHDCSSCNLLKLSQVGTLGVAGLLLAITVAPRSPVLPRGWLVDQRLSQPAARGPPIPFSAFN